MRKLIPLTLALVFFIPGLLNSGERKARKVRMEPIVASWYGPRFHGRKTANGEIYNMHSMTAAHTNLPFNTRIYLLNPRNRKAVIVRINDRGPYDPEKLRSLRILTPFPGRDIDISYQAARALGIADKGIARLYAAIVRSPR